MRTPYDLRFSLILALCIVFGAAQARNVNVPEAKPETVGFSSERLKRLDAGMKAIVDNKQLAGIATIVTRRGQVVQQMVYGQADIASNTPLQKDTIVRIYSMTKPITGVAMMILYEEGKWKPSDPISRHIPEFKDLKVFKSLDADGKPTLRSCPSHPPTMGELMSHTAGFTYGLFGSSPVDKMYGQANVLAAGFAARNSSTAWRRCRSLYQPGEGWVYSVGVDIQGYLVEKLSGQPFADFLRDAHLRAARHERHRVLRAAEQAVAAGDDLSAERRKAWRRCRTTRASARRRACPRAAADCIRRRPTICASRRCSRMRRAGTASACSRRARSR